MMEMIWYDEKMEIEMKIARNKAEKGEKHESVSKVTSFPSPGTIVCISSVGGIFKEKD